ncbi:MAG: STT3 domain-containing protein [Candidatus Bathyarchaeia archaeon]|nr:hypothetical protein [Candidatus Bathyarchaeota archaeon]
MIIVIASGIRLLPLRWGFYLNEFDPYFHYYTAKYVSDNGLMALFSWNDTAGWYPYGRVMRYYANFGLTLTAVAFYKILSFFGVPLFPSFSANPLDPLGSDPLYNLCVIFPIIMAALSCLAIYFLGRDLGGESVGLFSALFLALDPSHIGRTSLGWFDDETVGIFSALLLMLFFNRAIDSKKPLKFSIIYAILSGLSLAYLCASWGAARYLVVITALFTLILLILKRYSRNLLISYIITFGITFSLSYINPRMGLAFLLEEFNLIVYGILILLFMAEINRRITATKKKVLCMSILILVLVAALAFLIATGHVRRVGSKFLLTIFPFWRGENPLFESVAEHKPSSWATFYHSFSLGIAFALVGIFFAALSATNLSIFIIIYCLTSIYFASSLIRLNILASPSICLLWAFSLKRILSPLISSLEEEALLLKRKIKARTIGREVIGVLLVAMFILLSMIYVFGTGFIFGLEARPLEYANVPPTISGASLSVKPSSIVRDWIDTLIWMRENLPPSAVVASWWDYGYWITVIANKTTLADNGTINGTQIAQVGRMFMSNETEAVEILRKYSVTHVVVYVTFTNYGGDAGAGGDEGKWIWMALISGLASNENDARTKFGNLTLGWDYIDSNGNGQYDQNERVIENTRGQSTVLYKLMTYGKETTLYARSSITLGHFRKAYFSQKEGQPNPAVTFSGGLSLIPLVCVYEVSYD